MPVANCGPAYDYVKRVLQDEGQQPTSKLNAPVCMTGCSNECFIACEAGCVGMYAVASCLCYNQVNILRRVCEDEHLEVSFSAASEDSGMLVAAAE